ncbi:MAG: Glycine cleavage system H protein [uncultured bacterium]|nr:MAG: Glycine cleavage system H protein [uncultured bacterium]
MNVPQDLKFSKEHEWVKIDGKIAIIGVTDYAQEQLGDVVNVEFPPEGEEINKDEAFGVVESVKSVSDIFAPISGKVLEINEPLIDSPGIVNEDPYGEGWIVKIEITKPEEIKELMDAKAYQAYLAE